MTAKAKHHEGTFRRWAGPRGQQQCYAHSDECLGRLQAAHYISVQAIKREHAKRELLGMSEHPILAYSVDEWVADDRNGLVLCERHHNRFDHLGFPIEPPACVVAFATEAGLLHLVDPKEAAVAAVVVWGAR